MKKKNHEAHREIVFGKIREDRYLLYKQGGASLTSELDTTRENPFCWWKHLQLMGTPCLCSKPSPSQWLLYMSPPVPMALTWVVHIPVQGVLQPQVHPSHIPWKALFLHLPWKPGSHASFCHDHPWLCIYQQAVSTKRCWKYPWTIAKLGPGRFSYVPLSHLEPGNTLEEMQPYYA